MGGRWHFICGYSMLTALFIIPAQVSKYLQIFTLPHIMPYCICISALCTTALMEYRDFDDGLPKKNRILQARLRLTVLSTERLSVCLWLWIIWAFLLHTHACKKITVLFFQNTCCMQSFLLVCLPVFYCWCSFFVLL